MNEQTKKPEDLQAEVAILSAQLKGARCLIRHMQDKLEEVTAERNQLAGIGIECGCGEADCTADADNLRDALAHIRRLKAEIERLRASSFVTAVPSEHYERLVAAGDAMAKTIGENGVSNKGSFHDVADSVDRWHAAKEGKQP